MILDLSDSDLVARKHTFKLTNFIIQQTISPTFFFHFSVGKLSINPSLTKICFTVASHTDTFWLIIQSLLPNTHWEAEIA